MIQYEQVTVAGTEDPIIKDISFDIRRGERLVVSGPSGAGKSTILNALMGIVAPASGSIRFDDEILSSVNIAAIRSRIGYVGQEPVLGAENVREALLLPFAYRRNRRKQPSEETLKTVLARLNLDESIMTKPINLISGGEKQRIALARVLLLEKRVLVLDEITSALDRENIDTVINLTGAPEYTVLSVSHEPKWIDSCTHRIEIREGKIHGRG